MRQHSFVPIYAQQHPCWPVPPACPPACQLVAQDGVICKPHWSAFCCLLQVTENRVKQDKSQDRPCGIPAVIGIQQGTAHNHASHHTTQPGFYLWALCSPGPLHPDLLLAPLSSQPCKDTSEHAGQSSLSASSGGNHPVWWNCRGQTLSDNPWLNLILGCAWETS